MLTAALAVADRGYVLEVGKVVLSGTGRDLAANPRVQRAYLGMTWLRASLRRTQLTRASSLRITRPI